MSASWWGVCPICQGKVKKIEKKMKEKYGKISEKEYKKLLEKRDEIIKNDEENETVAVYDESYLDEESGNLIYDAGATCNTCGAEWTGKLEIKPNVSKKGDLEEE